MRRQEPELRNYNAKRRFGATAEPKGVVAGANGHAFVVQKHAARRLHYDLRLELDGVMKSWAVTRGPSLVPGEKRLAVAVEDHPVAYNKFEGTIPQGEYGGGTVMIWDRGSWQPDGDPHQGLAKGHLSFTLDGKKLNGGWHLVRLRRRPNEKRDNWLLIKQHDAAERSPRDKDILDERPNSVATGRSLDEIAEGRKKKVPRKKRRAARTRARSQGNTMITTKAKARAKKINGKAQAADPKPPAAGAPRAALPAFVPPCLATLADKAPAHGDWVHEIKFDGYRLAGRLDRGKARLMTRRGLDWTRKFPAIAAAAARLPAKTAMIDGEVVVEDEDGVSSFSLLQQALSAGDDKRTAFYVFDLLHLDGRDFTLLPLTARKEALAKLLAKAPRAGPLRLSRSIEGAGPELLAQACRLGLEGIISKVAGAPYRSGRGREWIKTKCSDRQEFVVAGFAPSSADAHAVGALVLAAYDHGKLRYAGRTGTGFTHRTARELYRRLSRMVREKPPLATVPKGERGARAPIWVEPKTVVEVAFHGWTHGDHVRQASFQGLREDKEASDVVRETKSAAAAERAPPKPARAPGRASKATVKIGNVALSHPNKIYWDDAGVTKAGLGGYYAQVWKWMRPHVVGRPLTLVRCPEGADLGQCFYQKHANKGIATGHLHLVKEDGDTIIAVDDLDGLVSLVQAGVLEIHTRGSTIAHLDKADRIIFDLDPGPGTGWDAVVAAARDLHDRLARLKLKTFLKTTGGKGLHVVLPVAPTPWDEVKEFARGVATALAADAPERYVAVSTKSKRNNRIFVDYLRNSREATAVAPYSTRARPGAPVAMPIAWSELGRTESGNLYDVKNAARRLARLRRDPWAGIDRIKPSLPKMK